MKTVIALLFLGFYGLVWAQPATQIQDSASLSRAAEEFIRQQTSEISGQVSITIGKIDSRLNLPACVNLSPFLLQGSKPWGKITLGIHCSAPNPWTIYVSALVQVQGDYYVAKVPLSQGHVIATEDMSKMTGDLSSLPAGAITLAAQAIGKSLTTSLSSGSPLRADGLKASAVVQQGQLIKIISTGPGFKVTTDALALTNAGEGQVARAKTTSGHLVSGIARAGGIIEINF